MIFSSVPAFAVTGAAAGVPAAPAGLVAAPAAGAVAAAPAGALVAAAAAGAVVAAAAGAVVAAAAGAVVGAAAGLVGSAAFGAAVGLAAPPQAARNGTAATASPARKRLRRPAIRLTFPPCNCRRWRY